MDQRETNHLVEQQPKPIRWVIPDTIRTKHATHLVVQQQGTEFILLFFELQTPIFTGSAEEQQAEYAKLASNDARCIAKIVMSAENVVAVTNSLIQSLNRLNDIFLANTKGQEDARFIAGTNLPPTD